MPGTIAAQVKITAVTAKGSYQPTGGTGIDLLGGSAVSIPLPSLGGVAGAISISSSVPVAATLLVSGGPAGSPGALAASSGPITEQGVVADNPAKSAGRTQLVLSAPQHAATVRITTATATVSATGQQGQVVQISAGSSVVVPVAPPAGQQGHRILGHRDAAQRRTGLRGPDHHRRRDRAVGAGGAELADVDTAPRRDGLAVSHPALARPRQRPGYSSAG